MARFSIEDVDLPTNPEGLIQSLQPLSDGSFIAAELNGHVLKGPLIAK